MLRAGLIILAQLRTTFMRCAGMVVRGFSVRGRLARIPHDSPASERLSDHVEPHSLVLVLHILGSYLTRSVSFEVAFLGTKCRHTLCRG